MSGLSPDVLCWPAAAQHHIHHTLSSETRRHGGTLAALRGQPRLERKILFKLQLTNFC